MSYAVMLTKSVQSLSLYVKNAISLVKLETQYTCGYRMEVLCVILVVTGNQATSCGKIGGCRSHSVKGSISWFVWPNIE